MHSDAEAVTMTGGPAEVSLNALSGIGCIRTQAISLESIRRFLSLNALSGIGCIRTG